jgi:hypothetical protein
MPKEDEAHAQAIAAEAHRARQLRMVVDLTSAVLVQGGLSRAEAEELVAGARRQALLLFPDKESTYELVLAPRFARLMDEFVGATPGEARLQRWIREPPAESSPSPDGARVLPFRRRS